MRKQKILFASTPRSGLHYFSTNLESLENCKTLFCEGYSCRDSFKRPVIECPARNLMGTREFCEMNRPIIKSHDFDLSMKIDQYEHIVIFRRRDVYAALISWFELCLENDWGGVEDSKEGFQTFVYSKLNYFVEFAKKYNQIENNKVSIWYEDLYNELIVREKIRQIGELIQVSHKEILISKIKPLRNSEEFIYYSRELEVLVKEMFQS